jgi:hypothetical protein
MEDIAKIIRCDCMTHGIEVTSDEDEPSHSVVINFWYWGKKGGVLRVWYRIKQAIHYVLHGYIRDHEEILLQDGKVEELINELQRKRTGGQTNDSA